MKEEWFHKERFQVWIDLNLRNLRELTDTVEELLENKTKNFKSWVGKEASKISQEKQEEFYELYIDEYHQLSKIFPNILRSSLFIMHYAFFESQLSNLCKSLQKQFSYPIKLTELRGKGIDRAKDYMKKIGKIINFPDQTPAWNNIKRYEDIRNFVMHKASKLDESKQVKKVETFINAKSSIDLDPLKNIQFAKSFCPEVNNTLQSFFNELFKVLP